MDIKGLGHLITVDPEIVSGTPVFRGTRVPLKALFDHLEHGEFEEFLDGFPSVTREHAEAVIRVVAKEFLAALGQNSSALAA